MNGSFNFNAPQYIDFSSPTELSHYNDDYFEMDHEIEIKYTEQDPLRSEVQDNNRSDCTEYSEVQNYIENDSAEYCEVNTLQTEHCDGENTGKEQDVKEMPIQEDNPSDSIDCAEYCNEITLETEYCDEENTGQQQNVTEMPKQEDNPPDSVHCESIEDMQNDTVSSTTQLSDAGSQIFEIVEVNPNPLRKSMSMGNIHKLQKKIEKNDIDEYLSKAMIGLQMSGKKTARRMENACTSTEKLEPRIRSKSRDNMLKIGLETSEHALPRKYVSMAEAIKNFQLGTPERFHSKSKNDQSLPLNQPHRVTCTIPQSPMLMSKTRTRPVYYLSHDKQEENTAEEMKKYHFKPQPLNYKIFKTPVAIKKNEEKNAFKIKKIPPRKVIEKLPAVSEGIGQNKVQVKDVELRYDGIVKRLGPKPLVTKIQPFSFEERNKIMKQRKEENIKKFLEDEKKAREFHARPIPHSVKSSSTESLAKNKSMRSNPSPMKNDENHHPNGDTIQFKARPATVIHKKPFQPKLGEKPLVEIQEFNLRSQIRAKEREEFVKQLKEKEESMVEHRKKFMEYVQEKEMEAINKLRKETVHKANPIRHYKIFEIQQSTKKLTSPNSPAVSRKRK